MRKSPLSSPVVSSVLALSCSLAWPTDARAETVWIESENTAKINATEIKDKLTLSAQGTGNSQFLGGGKWFVAQVKAKDVESEIPADGLLFSYEFKTSKSGVHDFWNRVGYEFVRSPFEWRVDSGAWNKSSPDDLTTNLMELSFFTEVAWLKLGSQNLNAGAHMLEIRLPKTKNDRGETQRILYASDAIAISDDGFVPNGKWKPGEDFQNANDKAAGKKVFVLPESRSIFPGFNGPSTQAPTLPQQVSSTRSSVELKGDWEVARHDEQMPGEVAAPIQDFPVKPLWTAIAVPSDKNKSRPDLVFAHRLWYRTRVQVPQSEIGKSFKLNFPMNSLNTTVYVNGTYCGFNKNPLTGFSIDVTKGIKAGVNEVWVGIRDAWYGRTANPDDPMKLRRSFNVPIKFFGDGFQDLAYPIWNNSQSGILEAPVLESAGAAYVSDVFVKPIVVQKKLNAQITVSNTTNSDVSGEIQWAAIDAKTGAVTKTFAAKPFSVDADKDRVLEVAESWVNAKVWWPNEPNMYRLRTSVVVGGKTIDTLETPFGFREWSTRGTQFTLNGINWPQWADLTPGGATKEEWLKSYRDTFQRTTRLMFPGQGAGQTRWYDLPVRETLNFMDENGVVVRRNGLLDGQAIGYSFSESDPKMKARHDGSKMKVDLMNNWRDQSAAQIRYERNHPSINTWTIENEFAFINLINLLGDSPLMDEYERKITDIARDLNKVDPTRTVMTDGGGATKAQTLQVHGNHYVFDPNNPRYPNLAYENNVEGGGRGRWIWDMKRPRFMGEDYFAAGINPADYAQWGGESAFLSKTDARPAATWVYKMLTEGYRWSGQSAWQFWSGSDTVLNPWNSQKWRAVFVRQYSSSFGSGQKVTRTWGIFNDTQYADAITFKRELVFGKKIVWTKTSFHNVAPGENLKFDEIVPMPTSSTRSEGQMVLTLSAKGQEIFRDVKTVSILPRIGAPITTPSTATPAKPSASTKTSFAVTTKMNAQVAPTLDAQNLFVYDPKGTTVNFLKSVGQTFTRLNSLANLPAAGRVLVVGADALTSSESTSSALAAWASTGRSVIVLDQTNPLKYQALTAEIDTAAPARSDFGVVSPTGDGSVAFPEDLNHAAMRGLKTGDFTGWGSNSQVYRNAYTKPARGARSLVQVGPRLGNTALVEVPTGRGVMLLSQLSIGANLQKNAVAQQLVANLLRYGATYKQVFRAVALASGGNAQLIKAADSVGIEYSKSADALAAISNPKIKLALIEATPANLKQLASNLTKVNAFNAAGGYIVFHGLAPEGLADYNKIVGFSHMIRPMRCERVQLSTPRNPLTAGLTLGDVVMLSGKRIFGWISDEYVADDIFSYIVDYDDVAPFAISDNGLWNNAVNGFVGADGWKLINDFNAPKNGPFTLDFTLPRAQTISEFTWDGSVNYNATTKVGLVVDGKTQSWNVPANGEAQILEVKPALSGTKMQLQLQDFQRAKPNDDGSYNIGIDNIWLKAARPASFYQNVKPMLNVGGLMQYTRGTGGIVLANLDFKDNEAVPINAVKKRTIFSTILRNLNAPFSGGKTIIAGAGLTYTPINFGDFKEKLNQYRTERGWFGDKNFTFNNLPTGKQKFGGIEYSIFDFATSPVPTAIMLGGNGIPNNSPQEVKDIPIGRKADALFFLHTARIDQRMNDDDRKKNRRFEMARYVINYTDGQSLTIPIISEIDIENYRQNLPRAIPGAQTAWTSKYTNSNEFAVAYSKQWNNPRPDVAIKSVDFVYGDNRERGVPVLLAITAATAK